MFTKWTQIYYYLQLTIKKIYEIIYLSCATLSLYKLKFMEKIKKENYIRI